MDTKIKLQNRLNLYKMVIPAEVEQKFRYLLDKIHNIEWSGILFYTCEGNLTDGLTITCKDVLPMNIGSSTFTEFEVNDEVLPYMLENDLMDCKQSLVHSHHSMSTFFSGIDMDTLADEGLERNNFVSLIVNNDGNYSAAITWKETYSIQGTTSLFGEEETFEREAETVVCYSFLTIEKEDTYNTPLDNRIKELKERKAENSFSNFIPKKDDFTPVTSSNYLANLQERKELGKALNSEEPTLFDTKPYIKEEPLVSNDLDIDVKVPKEVVDSAVAQLITGSLTAKRIPTNDTKKVLKEIDNRFADRFSDYSELGNAVDYLVTTVIEGMANHFAEDVDIAIRTSALATAVSKELAKYSGDLAHVELLIHEVKLYELE